MRRAATVSVIAHGAVLTWAVLSLGSHPFDARQVEAIPVALVSVADVTSLPKAAPPPIEAKPTPAPPTLPVPIEAKPAPRPAAPPLLVEAKPAPSPPAAAPPPSLPVEAKAAPAPPAATPMPPAPP